ncbi:MAG: TerB family tellurite resistance protein [Sphingobacteriaceae bacterium]|nr:TerB family tellurite resistance protein [Sphingobacteriaceae bacterium]
MFSIIGAIAGFILLGKSFVGAFIGMLVGSFIDNYLGKGNREDEEFKYYKRQTSGGKSEFASMLITLSAAVMRADGRALKVELDYIKKFFGQQFGPEFTTEHVKLLKHFLDGAPIPLEKICADIKIRTVFEVRLQLLHYLFGLANADGHVADSELIVLKRIALLLDIPNSDFESLKNMFWRDSDSDYKVLGIEKTANDEEVKKAYRQMAIRYHPDKVAQLGEEVQKGAKEKFQKIQEAYENIKKSRGMT